MINTFYSLNALDTSQASFLALLIGFGFGFALEQAGFSSSRRLAGVFYFTDMAVVKVMFSALITAILGLSYVVGFGWMSLDQVFLMPTIYGAQIVAGLLFGVGFVMGGWCPGTAAAGVAAGRIDALVFLLGVIGGSILFNELFPVIRSLYKTGDRGVQMAYNTVGMSRNGFILAFTLAAVAAFWLSERVEKARTGRAPYLGSPFLKAFSLALVALAGGLFVLSPAAPAVSAKNSVAIAPENAAMPRVVETDWLASKLGTPGLKIIDLRPQPEYNTAHIPGSLSLNVESFRGNIGGVPSMLLPPSMLAAQFSLLGLQPADTIILVSGDKLHDTTLAGMAFERLGHLDYAVMNGGYAKYAQEGWPADAALPAVTASTFPAKQQADHFTVDFRTVAARLGKPGTVIIDVRPTDFYTGKKSDEARAGHIPGALSRPFTEDVVTSPDKTVSFKPSDALAAAYREIIPSTNTEIIVHCRTGHQASQTYFVLKRMLGYQNVRWYDAGWTEWAARPELPIVSETRN